MNQELYSEAVRKSYAVALNVWFASGVERYAEGHPGLRGPFPFPPGDDYDWDKAHLEGAIHALQTVLDRLYFIGPQPEFKPFG